MEDDVVVDYGEGSERRQHDDLVVVESASGVGGELFYPPCGCGEVGLVGRGEVVGQDAVGVTYFGVEGDNLGWRGHYSPLLVVG